MLNNHSHILNTLNLSNEMPGASTSPSWWSQTKDSGEIISYSPIDGEAIAKVNCCSKSDYDHVVQKSLQAFSTWKNVPAPKRGDLIKSLGRELRHQKENLASLVALEAGKSKQEALGEVQEMIDIADFAQGLSRMLYGKTMHSERQDHRLYEQWHPLGPVGIITSFNFPVAVWAWNACIAAVCGNSIIWKPSHKTPLTAIAVQNICNRIAEKHKAPSLFSLFITHDHEFAKDLVADRRIPLISFTGSTQVGKLVGEVVAKRLGRSLLELGGNNASIVDETADLKLAKEAILFGAIGTAGQRCTTIRRLIIHESIYEKFLNQLISAYQAITIGTPLEENNLMGPLIDRDAVDLFLSAIEEIKKAGGQILFGGKTVKGKGYFVEPTLVEAKNDWEIVQKETFAPILYVMKYRHFEEAIAMANHSAHGLAASLFTTNLQRAEMFLAASGSDCGIANINIGTSGAEIGGAFGGEKDTGGGREAGSDAWKAYMRRQTNTINWGQTLTLSQGIKFNES